MVLQTGLSSQSSPYSSIFADRSSTRGLINSISCRIWEGRFDSKRDTILGVSFSNKGTRIDGIMYGLRGFGNKPMIAPKATTLVAKDKFKV